MTINFIIGLIAGLIFLIVLRLCEISNRMRKIIGIPMLIIGIVLDFVTKKETGISLLEILQTFFACTGLAVLFGLCFEWWEIRRLKNQVHTE